jgi:hypothetical protein
VKPGDPISRPMLLLTGGLIGVAAVTVLVLMILLDRLNH